MIFKQTVIEIVLLMPFFTQLFKNEFIKQLKYKQRKLDLVNFQ